MKIIYLFVWTLKTEENWTLWLLIVGRKLNETLNLVSIMFSIYRQLKYNSSAVLSAGKMLNLNPHLIGIASFGRYYYFSIIAYTTMLSIKM